VQNPIVSTISVPFESKLNRWQIPIGGGVGKITKIGKQPIALRLHLYGNVVRPDNGPEALLRFTITFLFPK
jgi:hypothetical protein